MSAYRTEIVVPLDRCIHIYVPDDFPIGAARLLIEPMPAPTTPGEAPSATTAAEIDLRFEATFLERRVPPVPDLDHERQDVEWWEEFEDDDDDA